MPRKRDLPSDPPPAEERVYDTGGLAAELFWYKHRWTILFGVAIVLAIAGAVGIWLFTQHSARRAAEALFAAGQDPVAWREVIVKYPASASAASAHFLLAESLRSEGKLNESSSVYESFLAAFPSSSLVGGARLGLAQNLAVAGEINEAMAALQELQARDSGSYAASFASLLEARALIGTGKLEEARKVLANLLATYPHSPPGRAAASQLDALAPLLPPQREKAAQ